ncbi:MAG: hypothetical protein HYT49_01555 [Candidatus Wildermuthbacteria bacterium]|nr:hypothetical protein [Candidatus Wildermuthbacteria bacterium]
MKKRVIDIYPPHSRSETLQEEERFSGAMREVSETKGRHASRTAALLVFVLLLFVLSVPFVHFFFARATVQVWPQITKLRSTEYIVAQVGYDTLNLERKIIRARVFEEEAAQTMLFPASGKKFKAESARGIIRVYNENSTQPQALVANTRFISEDGKIFHLESAASIPGGQMDGRKLVPGFLDVTVVAAEPGEDYNIGPSKFSLPGLVGSPLYTKIHGESLRPMTGGAQREVAVVQEEDIASARGQLVESLKAQATKSLLAKVPPQFQVLSDSLVTTVVEDNSLVKPEAELEQFNYTAKVRVSMHAFHKDDADVLAKYLLATHLAASQAIDEKTLRIDYQMSGAAAGAGVVPITVQIAADQYEKVDTTAIARHIGGVSTSQLRQLMKEYPFLAKAQFSLWPFWVARVPQDIEKVHLEVLLEG